MNIRRLLLLALPLCGCASDPTPAQPPPGGGASVHAGGLEYTAATRVAESFPVQLFTTVTIRNHGSSPAQLTFPDGCVVLLRAYRDGRASPAWDEQRDVGCTMALVEVEVPAGGSHALEARTDAARILGDSLPDGRYALRALLRPNGTEVEVPAGTVSLAVPR